MQQDDAPTTSGDEAARSEASRENSEDVETSELLAYHAGWHEYYETVCEVSGRRFVSRPVNLTPEQRKRFADILRSFRREVTAYARLDLDVAV